MTQKKKPTNQREAGARMLTMVKTLLMTANFDSSVKRTLTGKSQLTNMLPSEQRRNHLCSVIFGLNFVCHKMTWICRLWTSVLHSRPSGSTAPIQQAQMNESLTDRLVLNHSFQSGVLELRKNRKPEVGFEDLG